MATLLTPDCTYTLNGVPVRVKLIPDGAKWNNAAKAKAAKSYAGAPYKHGGLICGTGKPASVTIHNTDDLPGAYDDGEQYTRATWPNENMGTVRVHFYADDTGAWQNLRAGTGLCPADPVGRAEVGYHAGDGVVRDGGNMTSIAIEVIMNDNPENDAKARDNAARLAAGLLDIYGYGLDKLVTHTFWVAKSARKSKVDVDEQCTTQVYGRKWCPTYIFGSTSHAVALKNWRAFKALVARYMGQAEESKPASPAAPAPKPPYQVRITRCPNIRKGPGTNFAVVGVVGKSGVYTITEVSDGPGASGWGRLKSGAGWVSLDFCAKI